MRHAGALGSILVLTLTLASPSRAAQRAPLPKLKALIGAPSEVQRGGNTSAVVKVVNPSRRKSSRASVVGLLSRDTTPNAADTRVGKVPVRALAPGKRTSVRLKITLPNEAAAGAYRLFACVATATGKLPARPSCRSARLDVKGTGGSRVQGPDPADAVETPNPRSVTPSIAGQTSAWQLIGPSGGEIVATATDGSVMTLVVPADALLSEVKITMTPLAEVGGLPFAGGLVSGVDIQPHGLRLQVPATLRFAPTAPLSAAGETPFAYSVNGADLRLYPLSADPGVFEMQLAHFSGYGLAEGTSAERDDQRTHPPADPEAQLEQQAQRVQEAVRNGSDASELAAEFITYSRTFWQQVVRPRLIAAETDDTLARIAVASFASWNKSLAHLGLDGDFAQEIAEGWQRVEQILAFAYEQAYERCLDGDVQQAAMILAYHKERVLFGFVQGSSEPIERWQRCVRYELTYDMRTIQSFTGTKGTEVTTVGARSVVPLELAETTTGFDAYAQGTGDYQTYEYTITGQSGTCPVVATTTESTQPMSVRVALDLNSRQEATDQGLVEDELADAILIFKPGRLTERYKTPGCLTHEFERSTHVASFFPAHRDRYKFEAEGNFYYVFDQWSAATPPALATFQDHFAGGSSVLHHDVTTRFKLIHRPGT